MALDGHLYMNRQTPNRDEALTSAQQNALDHVRESAQRNQKRNLERIAQVLASSGIQRDPETLLVSVRRRASITINFHPDRLVADGRSVAVALYEDGMYRSQFESKISNGGLTAFPGGDRDRWEEALFGGAYQAAGVTEAERPKYGGLNLMNYSDGACPRFGSCHFRLKPATLERSTFTFGDSVSNPEDRGVIDAFEPVLAALLERVAADGNAVGRVGVRVPAFVDALTDFEEQPGSNTLLHRAQGRALDEYVEAQIRGVLRIAKDVEGIVVDPSYQGTATGEILQAMAERYDFPLDWHHGFELSAEETPDDFRGPEMPALAKRVVECYAVDRRRLDAAAIGLAARSVITEPEAWWDWASAQDTLQHLKYLWHILVVYGKPRGQKAYAT